MALVITGGAGFIGSYVAEALLERGRTVRVVDSLVSGHPRNLKNCLDRPNFELVEADVRDGRALDRVFAQHRIDAVMHFAGLKAVGESVAGFEKPPSWFGYLAPANTPAPIVNRVQVAVLRALESPEVKKSFDELVFITTFGVIVTGIIAINFEE